MYEKSTSTVSRILVPVSHVASKIPHIASKAKLGPDTDRMDSKVMLDPDKRLHNNLGVKATSPKGISPLHGAILVGFGILCFYIGRADSLSEQLEQREKYNQRQRLRLGEQSQIQAC